MMFPCTRLVILTVLGLVVTTASFRKAPARDAIFLEQNVSKADTKFSALVSCSDTDVPINSEEIAAQESLKDSNKWSNLYIGAATNYNVGMTDASEYWYWQLFSHHFDLTTAENGCKMKQVLWNGPEAYGGPSQTKCSSKGWEWGSDLGNTNTMEICYKFELCDKIVLDNIAALGTSLGVAWRGHALIWGAPDSTFSWHQEMAQDATALTQFIQTYIEDVLAYYSGDKKALAWDVVNEAVKDSATGASSIEDSLKDNDYSSGLGTKYEYIQVALNAARSADSDLKIFYNDYRILWQNDKSDAVYNLLQSLINDGYPIDGIGFQSHLNFGFIDEGNDLTIKSNLKRFADLGLELHITELDVGCNYMSKYQSSGCLQEYDNDIYGASNAERQAEIYAAVLKACLEVPKCSVFEMWGFTDYTFGSLPYLFDCNGKPKDAFNSVLSLLKQEEESGCVEVAVVKYNIPSSDIAATISLTSSDSTAISSSTSDGGLSRHKSDYVSACLTSGTWTLTLTSDASGWAGGSYSVEGRDGTVLVADSTFSADSEATATFTVGTVISTPAPTVAPTDAPTDAPTTAPTAATGTCVARWKRCSDGDSCCDAADSCYVKSASYSQCRPSCPTSWSCAA